MQGNVFDMAFAGILVGAVIVITIISIPLVRIIASMAATSAIAIGYLRGGVPELVAHADALQAEIMKVPTFTAGVIVGAVLAVVLGVRIRRRPVD